MANNGDFESTDDQPDKIEDMLMHMKVENQKILDEMENHFNKTGDHLYPES